MTARTPRFVLGRLAAAALLVVVVSSGAQLLAQLAPGDYFGTFAVDARTAAAERHRLGLDRPAARQYGTWLSRTLRLDFGESLYYRQPVLPLVRDRAANTAVLALAALLVATLLGVPAGVFTGSRGGGFLPGLVRALSIVLVSVPPLITSLLLLTLAARTGWLPVSGMGGLDHLVVPALALGLPLAATIQQLQAQALRQALARPSTVAAVARGVPRRRVVWIHGWRLSLGPLLAIYGIIAGSLFSGSFAVEMVTSWPGLGDLMRNALVARDTFLVAGCAAAGALLLAIAIVAADLAHAALDPRVVNEGP